MMETPTRTQIKLTLLAVISSATAMTPDQIKQYPALSALGIDSVSRVDILMALEKAFNLEIPPEDVEKIDELAEALDYFESRLTH